MYAVMYLCICLCMCLFVCLFMYCLFVLLKIVFCVTGARLTISKKLCLFGIPSTLCEAWDMGLYMLLHTLFLFSVFLQWKAERASSKRMYSDARLKSARWQQHMLPVPECRPMCALNAPVFCENSNADWPYNLPLPGDTGPLVADRAGTHQGWAKKATEMNIYETRKQPQTNSKS